MIERRSPPSERGSGGDERTIGRRVLISVAGAATLGLAGCGDIVEPLEEDDDGGEDYYEIHEHGTLTVEIDGQPVDFSRDTYVYPDSHPNPDFPPFHFHRGSDDRWHMETDERLSFAEPLDALPETTFEEESGGHVLTIEGETYDDGDEGTSVRTLVGGESVDPFEYEVHDGDDLRVEVTTSEG